MRLSILRRRMGADARHAVGGVLALTLALSACVGVSGSRSSTSTTRSLVGVPATSGPPADRRPGGSPSDVFAYVDEKGTHVLVGSEDSLVSSEKADRVNTWAGDRLVFTASNQIFSWAMTSRSLGSAQCTGCVGVAPIGGAAAGRVGAVSTDRQLLVFDPGDLARGPVKDVQSGVPLAQQPAEPDIWVLGETGGRLLVGYGDIEAPGARGLPNDIDLVDEKGEATRRINGNDLNGVRQNDVSRFIGTPTMSADGTRLIYTELGPSSACMSDDAVGIVDLRGAAPRLTPNPPVASGSFARAEAAFFSEGKAYAVFSGHLIASGGAPDPDCGAETMPSTLFRLDGDRWVPLSGAPLGGVATTSSATAALVDSTGSDGILLVMSGGRSRRIGGRVLYLLSCPPGSEEQPLPPSGPPALPVAKLSDRWVALFEVYLAADPGTADALNSVRSLVPDAIAVSSDDYPSLSKGLVLIVEPGPFIVPDQVIRYCNRAPAPGRACQAKHLTQQSVDREAVPQGAVDSPPAASGMTPSESPASPGSAFGLYDRNAATAATGRWVAQLAARPLDIDQPSLAALYSDLNEKMPGVELFKSDDFASFNNGGFWVIYHPGPFTSAQDALAFCAQRGRSTREQCYARILSHDTSDRPRYVYP